MSSLLLRLVWNVHTRAAVLWLLRRLPLCRGRVLCVCWGGQQYGCNPQAITDALLQHAPGDFQVAYAFVCPEAFREQVPAAFRVLQIGSLAYYHWLFTSQFLISNTRFAGDFFPVKRRRQLYIHTGHGGCGIKKIETDASQALSAEYLRRAAEDTRRIDLMLSGSTMQTQKDCAAYRYHGEMLELGLPRNDVFFRPTAPRADRRRYLVYAPTFRANGRRDVYGFDIDRVVAALEQRFGGEWYVRISSHPNMRHYYREIYDFSHPRVIDIGGEDLQTYLLDSDALISDYSSSEMDFMLRDILADGTVRPGTLHPVFQLCRDMEDYDRGFYLDPRSLPFPFAQDDAGLLQQIATFDEARYRQALDTFCRHTVGICETGHASEAVVDWMKKHL